MLETISSQISVNLECLLVCIFIGAHLNTFLYLIPFLHL